MARVITPFQLTATVWLIPLLLGSGVVAATASEPKSFAYVLQASELSMDRSSAVSMLAECGRDWIILDGTFDGDEDSRWTAAEIRRIRKGRSGRKVIAYLSIGEAEDYRAYWRREWKTRRPEFLRRENPDWRGNYTVRFWMKPWQSIVFAEIDRLMAQGFDGLYLDKVDIHEDFEYDPTSREWIDDRRNPATGNSHVWTIPRNRISGNM